MTTITGISRHMKDGATIDPDGTSCYGVPIDLSESITFSVTSETWRFRAYVAFWGMILFSVTISTYYVAPRLLEGPDTEGDSCNEFGRNNTELGEGGVYPGKGWDFKTQSHLVELFGYGNICTNWDYSPARELTAMVYPLFEYSLLIYIVMDFFSTTLAYKRGEITEYFWTFSKIIFPINLFLCAMFRMIFVCIAYEKVEQHTAGFLGLQISLILVAVSNSAFIWNTKTSYDSLGGLRNTRIAVLAYIIGDLIICSFKISATIYVVTHGKGAKWTMEDSLIKGTCVGQIVDMIWMIFNAIVPLFISYFRSRNEHPLEIKINQSKIHETSLPTAS